MPTAGDEQPESQANTRQMANKDKPWVLGISASHNGAVCLLKGDEIVVAIQEERLTRKKRHKIFGAQHSQALDYCFDYAGIRPQDLSMAVMSVPGAASSPTEDLKLNSFLQVEQNRIPTATIGHHYAHALSAFATSGFQKTAILVVDGIGSPLEDLSEEERRVIKWPVAEGWEMISLYAASETTLTPLEKHITEGCDWLAFGGPTMSKFRSLGTIFGAAAEQIFNGSLDAGKVMGLAPYGEPEIPAEDFFEIIDGRFVFSDKVPERFRHNERWPLRQTEYANLACSAQAALEKGLLYLVRHLHDLCPGENLCYAGGVALNSVANERIIRESAFKNIYIIPAAEDSGPAIGAAYYGAWQLTRKNSLRKLVHDAVGRQYSTSDIMSAIADTPAVEIVPSTDILTETVELLCQGKNLGWFQGKSELGPRALGQRSIICDPRRADSKDILNKKVKRREAFRPFAPVALLEEAPHWFELDGVSPESPFMLRVAKFKESKRELVPAVVHVDGTGRLQTVTREANGLFYELVRKFYERTSVPIILNTSFNVMGMPIVETPADALFCLLSTELDYCVLEKTLVRKREKILLGPDVTAHDELDQLEPLLSAQVQKKSAPQSEVRSYRSLSGQVLRSLQDYAGAYEHPSGLLEIEQEEEHLKGSFRGMFTTLERYYEDTFVATGELFHNFILTFLANHDDIIDRVSILVGPGIGESGEATFTRVSTTLDKDMLEQFTGEYERAGQTLEVNLVADDKLIVTVAGQPDYELVAEQGSKFNLKNTPGYSIEFRKNSSETIHAVVTQPNGVFVLKRK